MMYSMAQYEVRSKILLAILLKKQNFRRFYITYQKIKEIGWIPRKLRFFRVRISSTFSVLRPFSYLRPFLDFDRSTSTSLLRPLYFDSLTSTSVLRHFVKSGVIIGREAQVEVQFWSK